MLAYQLDFFKTPEESKLDALEQEIENMKSSLDKQRKSQFAKIGECNKKIISLDDRLSVLERNICRGVDALDKADLSRDMPSSNKS